MTTAKILPIWDESKNNINEYSSKEILCYYRIAKWIVDTNENKSQKGKKFYIAKDICNLTDTVLDAMKNISDYRMSIISDILRREYCTIPQMNSVEKITQAKVSRSTYYAYLKEGVDLFEEIKIIIQRGFNTNPTDQEGLH